jgi:hypothetical protein
MAGTVQNAEGHQAIVDLGISSRIFFVTCTVRSAAHVCPVVVTNRHTYGCCRSVSEVVAFPAFISRWSTRRHVAKLRGAHQHGKGLLKSKGHTRVYCLPEACCARAGAKHDTKTTHENARSVDQHARLSSFGMQVHSGHAAHLRRKACTARSPCAAAISARLPLRPP